MPYLFDEKEYEAATSVSGYNGGRGMWRSTNGGFITAHARTNRRFSGDIVNWGGDRGLAAWKAFDALAPHHLLARADRRRHYGIPAAAKDQDELVIDVAEQGHRFKYMMVSWTAANPWARPIFSISGPDGRVASVVGEWRHKKLGELMPKQWRTLFERSYVTAFSDADTAAALHLELGFNLCARIVDVDLVGKDILQHSRYPWSRSILSTPVCMPYSERVLSGAYGFLTAPYGPRGEDRASKSERGGLFANISPSVYSSVLEQVAKQSGASESFMDDRGSLAGRHARARHYHRATAALKLAGISALVNTCGCGRLEEAPEAALERLVEFHDGCATGAYRGHINCPECSRVPDTPDSPDSSSGEDEE